MGRLEMYTELGKPEGKRPFGNPRNRWEDNKIGSSRNRSVGAGLD
jgi:hypothetical protein